MMTHPNKIYLISSLVFVVLSVYLGGRFADFLSWKEKGRKFCGFNTKLSFSLNGTIILRGNSYLAGVVVCCYPTHNLHKIRHKTWNQALQDCRIANKHKLVDNANVVELMDNFKLNKLKNKVKLN